MEKLPEDKEKSHIRETVVKKSLNRKVVLIHLAELVVAAVIFGAVSCFTFVGIKPLIENKTAEIEKESRIETTVETTLQETKPIETQPVKEESDSHIKILELSNQLEKSMVQVISTTKNTDWFDTDYEKEGSMSGIILDITQKDVIILTSYAPIKQANQLKVTFNDSDEKVNATLLSTNKIRNLATLKVNYQDLSKTIRSKIEKVTYESSSKSLYKGNPVLALGSPNGLVGSLNIGYLSLIEKKVQEVDHIDTVVYTDFSVKDTSFLFNLEGNLIAIYGSAKDFAVSIESLKDEIHALEKNLGIGYLGIYGKDITFELAKTHDLPYGIYITQVVEKGVAYKSGLQKGDIIAKIDNKTVLTMQDLWDYLLSKDQKETCKLSVKRSSVIGYQTIDLNIELGKR
ncbi:Serine protease, DegP/HtrA, do-like protein [Lachnospiraceae bacterium TWA4]|nr:Serine protease, DegP/HtrA, do-like protein [Lachnospiraceae bacterium TWA4]